MSSDQKIRILSQEVPKICPRCDGWGYKKGSKEEPTVVYRKKGQKLVPIVTEPGSGCVVCRGRGTL